MWLCGAYVALAPYPLTVVVVVQDSKPKTSSYYTHSSFNLKHRKSWWSSSTGSTMSPTTLSPATPSQVYWKKTKKTEQWFCFWVFVSTRKGLLIFFFCVAFQLCSGKSGIFCPSQALMVKPARRQMMGKGKGMRIVCQATSIPADRVPDMGKRQLMNLLLLGAISLPTAGMLVPYATFFAPPG